MKSTKTKICVLAMVLTLLTLAACSNSHAPSSSATQAFSENTAPSSAPESVPVSSSEKTIQNSDLAAVLAAMKTEPEKLTAGCDKTENSSGSLTLQAGDELIIKISDLLAQSSLEELTLASQPPYSSYVMITTAQNENGWTLTFLEEYDDTNSAASPATFLSLMKQGYPEPVFFSLDRAAFDEIYGMANDMVYMPEPPKEDFIEPLRSLLEAYQDGTIKNNELEPRFEEYPTGEAYPVIQTIDDFMVEAGNDMVSYHVIIPLGNGSKWKMVVGMASMYPPITSDAPQQPSWNAVSASFISVK